MLKYVKKTPPKKDPKSIWALCECQYAQDSKTYPYHKSWEQNDPQ